MSHAATIRPPRGLGARRLLLAASLTTLLSGPASGEVISELNPGFNDAWFNPETAGQGIFINVFPDIEQLFLAWFTFDAVAAEGNANLGAAGQRWLTAIGPIEGNQAELEVSLTSGGVFDSASPRPETVDYGRLTLTFQDCSSAELAYDLPAAERRGRITLQRVVNENIALCEALLAEASLCAPERLDLAPNDVRLRFTGRWQRPESAPPRVSWAGASVLLRFQGESASVELDPGNVSEQFRIVVNGEPQNDVLVATPGRQRYVLAEDLDPSGRHTIQLMKETYYGNQTTIHGFELNACEVLEAPVASPRRIAFFGDSNMDGTSLYDEKDGGDSGAWFAYPATVGRILDAEISLQAFGGATLTQNPNNNVFDFITAQRRNRNNDNYRDGFDPQVIVVNAGANDIYAVTGADQKARIKDRYKSVIARLREVYGEAPHIILYNAYGWDLNEPANYSNEVVAEVGGNLSTVRYPWIWEQFHGAMAEHGGQARFLAESIAALNLGFEVVRTMDHIEGWGRDFNVANGGFENAARSNFNAFGWRYADDGVARINDPGGAYEGEYHIRLEAGEEVHQGTEATGDFEPGATGPGQRYEVTAWVRAVNGPATARLQADFEEQALYGRANATSETFEIGPEWTEISATFTAPAGTWKTFITLASAAGTVDFDAVTMRDPDA
ncbi:MAG: carbohydrate binding domain-containing protein [Pseudomonadota bacterium]